MRSHTYYGLNISKPEIRLPLNNKQTINAENKAAIQSPKSIGSRSCQSVMMAAS